MKTEIAELLENCIDEKRILVGEELKNHTTFRVGGPAKSFVMVNTVNELSTIIKLLKAHNEPYFVIGNGSNLLVSDEGYEGVVIRLEGEFLKLEADGDFITAGAGVMLSKVCVFAKDNELAGMEFAYGIPGTVGGAMVMNAGAYGGEMKDIVEKVTLLTKDSGIVTLSKSEMKFGYRDSILKHEPLIVLETVFGLNEGNKEEIFSNMQDYMERRRSKQPIELPSAGSTFKRPEGNFAGKLIMEAGLSGRRVGGACVSPKHCGFVVNDKGGTASDIDRLMKTVTDAVYKNSGIVLEPEVIKIGHFGE